MRLGLQKVGQCFPSSVGAVGMLGMEAAVRMQEAFAVDGGFGICADGMPDACTDVLQSSGVLASLSLPHDECPDDGGGLRARFDRE